MVTPDFIEKIKQVLQKSGVPQADVSYVVASWWIQDQVPEIQNEDQYQEYLRRWHTLAAAGTSEPRNFARSREGIDSLGARLIDWEEKAAATCEQEKTTAMKMHNRGLAVRVRPIAPVAHQIG